MIYLIMIENQARDPALPLAGRRGVARFCVKASVADMDRKKALTFGELPRFVG